MGFVSLILAEAVFQSIYQAACSSHFKADEAIINSEVGKKKKKKSPLEGISRAIS